MQMSTNMHSSIQANYSLSDGDKKIMCFTADGTLYISQSHKQSNQVLSFMEQLRRDKMRFTIRLVDIEHIASLYKQYNSDKLVEDNSQAQNTVADIIKQAVAHSASDIHIIVQQISTKIKFRVDGELLLITELSPEDGNTLCATIYQTMCDVAEPVFNPHRSQDGRLTSAMLNINSLYSGRVATRPTDSGLLMVIRLLYDRGSSNLELESLGYLTQQVDLINHMAAQRFGINILSGPTGSGKSTTLECILKRIISLRNNKSHILTLEDPPEYQIKDAVQTPIICDKNDDGAINREWARAIANAMRLDPDILMCGEVRDHYSATATFRAAMTGHGVWTTVHANDALSVLTRLQDIGISPSLLGDSALITGLINQVLVKKLCNGCKKPYEQEQQLLPKPLQQRVARYCQPEHVYVRGNGCSNCKNTGIAGRIVVAEVIEPDNILLELFLKKGKNEARSYWLEELNGVTKNSNLIFLINQGTVDPQDGEHDVCMLDYDVINNKSHKNKAVSLPVINNNYWSSNA